jgi:nucleolar protein 6
MLNQKLTKKQKKALAFRERKGKSKHILKDDDEGGDVPIDENQDLAEMESIQMEGQEEVGQDNTLNSVGKKQTKTGVQSTSENKKKRKRDDDDNEETQKSVKKKKKASDEESTKGTPQRFILFIGEV